MCKFLSQSRKYLDKPSCTYKHNNIYANYKFFNRMYLCGPEDRNQLIQQDRIKYEFDTLKQGFNRLLLTSSCYFRKINKIQYIISYLRPTVSVVQWIEFWFPVPTMGVRIPSGTLLQY